MFLNAKNFFSALQIFFFFLHENNLRKTLIPFIGVCHIKLLLTCLVFTLCACDQTAGQQNGQRNEAPRKELFIYCGMTMTQPVMELAALVEKEKNCTIRISYGESGWLKNTAMRSKTGDIFFPGPGAPSYLQTMVENGMVNKTVTVGQNRIVLMVQKGNPKQVRPDLKELLRGDLQIVLGAPDAGSIGKETLYILDKLGIYEQAANKALYLAADSKGLAQALRSRDADVVVNWQTMVTFHNNDQFMDVIPLPEAQSTSRPLEMGLLSFSRQQELAEYFMARAGSETGLAIFSRYGF